MPPKRKQPQDEEEENEQLAGNAVAAGGGMVMVGGVSVRAASLHAVRKPFKVGGAAAGAPGARPERCVLTAACLSAASHRCISPPPSRSRRAAPQPPMASRPEANGRGVRMGLSFSRLAMLGPGGLLQQAVTKVVTIGRRLGDGCADDVDAPDVLLFDPHDYPGGAVLGAGPWAPGGWQQVCRCCRRAPAPICRVPHLVPLHRPAARAGGHPLHQSAGGQIHCWQAAPASSGGGECLAGGRQGRKERPGRSHTPCACR